MWRMSGKTFILILGIVMFLLYLGSTPTIIPKQEPFDKPDESKGRVLGYYYDKQEFKYETEYNGPKIELDTAYHEQLYLEDLLENLVDDLEYYRD